jgi:primosomal replication protein N
MIRTYSDPLIAINVSSGSILGTTVTTVTAESEAKEESRYGERFNVYFYGKQADRASEKIVQGTKFTFRGIVKQDKTAEVPTCQLVAKTFAVVD